jgi:hypothetical protein
MLTCPLCKTEVAQGTPRCPKCQTDLTLLADFESDMQTLLNKAETHRKAGELAAAVETYLAVLETDPANAEAREVLGPALMAIRTASRLEPSRPAVRGWLLGLLCVVLAFAGGVIASRHLGW